MINVIIDNLFLVLHRATTHGVAQALLSEIVVTLKSKKNFT